MTSTERSLDAITTEITQLAAQALTTTTVVKVNPDDAADPGIYVSLRPEIARGRIELTAYYFDDGGHAYDVTLRVDRAVPVEVNDVVVVGDEPLSVNGIVGSMDEPPKDAA